MRWKCFHFKTRIKADLPVYKQEEKFPKFGKNVSLCICTPVPICGQLLDTFISTRKKRCWALPHPRPTEICRLLKKAWRTYAGCWYLAPAGMQPHAQHHTVLVEKELLLGPLKPQRGDKPEGVYWWGCSLSLPRILTFNVYNMLCHLILHYLMSLFPLHHDVNDVHANMWERRGQGRESCKCVFYAKWSLMKVICFSGAFESIFTVAPFPCLPRPYSMNIQQCSFLLLPPAGQTLFSSFPSLQALPCGSEERSSVPLLPISMLSPLQTQDSVCCSHLYSHNCCSNQKSIIKISLKRVEPSLCTQLQKLESTNAYKSLTTNVFNTQRKA